MERAFSGYMAKSGDAVYAAEKAGYRHPGTLGPRLARNADVAEEVRRRSREKLRSEGAEVGVDTLIAMAKDTLQKGSTRVAAAKALVQMSGLSGAQDSSDADLAELPADKIQALLHETQRLLAERLAAAKTIEHEPTPEIEPVEVIEQAEPDDIFA